MTIVVRLRTVVVDGTSFEVPTNVCWQETKRLWIVRVLDKGKSKYWYFREAEYGGSVSEAFKAACECVAEKRRNPNALSSPKVQRVLKQGFPALPPGIFARRRTDKDGVLHFALQVSVTRRGTRYFALGPEQHLTIAHYESVLKEALDYQKHSVSEREKEIHTQRTQALQEINQRLAYLDQCRDLKKAA